MLTTDKLNEYCRKYDVPLFSPTDSPFGVAHKAMILIEKLINALEEQGYGIPQPSPEMTAEEKAKVETWAREQAQKALQDTCGITAEMRGIPEKKQRGRPRKNSGVRDEPGAPR